MRAGLLLETITHLILAVATSVAVVALTMLLFGIHETVWADDLDDRPPTGGPASLLGRVASVSMLAAVGGSSIGAIVGGLLAAAIRPDGAVLVRVLRVGDAPGPDLEARSTHRPAPTAEARTRRPPRPRQPQRPPPGVRRRPRPSTWYPAADP